MGLFPSVFQLVRNTYRSVEEWAVDRGSQIREAFYVQQDTLRPEGTIKPSSMSADAWNEKKIATLNPGYQPNFRAFMAEAQSVARGNNRELIIWDAVRSLERQLELYKRGRTEAGTVVTKTIAASTGHIWGLAVDLVLKDPVTGGYDGPCNECRTKSWPAWYKGKVLPLAKKHGLESLFLTRGIDLPHIEAPRSKLPAVIASAAKQIRSDFPGLA